METVIKKICLILLLFLATIAMLVDCIFIYYKLTNKDNAVNTSFVNSLDKSGIEKLAENQVVDPSQYIFEMNLFSNKANNGKFLADLRLNYYTDVEKKEVFSTGLQTTSRESIGKVRTLHENWFVNTFAKIFNLSKNRVKEDDYFNPDFYYYNSYKNESYKATQELTRSKEMIITIGNDLYSIKLDGTLKKTSSFLFWTWETTPEYYTYDSLLTTIIDSIESLSYDFGDYLIPIDMSKYFSVKKYNTTTKKFEEDNMATQKFTYVTVKVHFSKNGVVLANQSLFKCIEFNPNFDYLGINTPIEYWQANAIYNLTEKDLDYRFTDIENGSYGYFNSEYIKKLNDIKHKKINIILDLDSKYLKDKKINLIGLDFSAFLGCKIDTLKIVGNNQTFKFLSNSLIDTGIEKIDSSSSINLIFEDNSKNNEVAEVIV